MEEQKKYSVGSESKEEKIEEDEDEEEEVDRFISLIKQFREARNFRINELNKSATTTTTTTTTTNNLSKRRKIWNGNEECSGWIPKFEIQDFNISQRPAPASKCNSKQRIDVKESSKEENDGEGSELNLRLSL